MRKNNEWQNFMKNMSKAAGFSLVELMVAVAIIGVLAAIAIPSYQSHINKSKEAEAQAALLSLANAMSQYYLETTPMTYLGAAEPQGSGNSTGSPWIFPEEVPPGSGAAATYHLNITAATATPDTFTVTATPVDPALTEFGTDQLGNKFIYVNGAPTLSSW
jgi:type IV pilus assembly protein PilE